jgi:uncharacterized membrane protein
MDNFVKIGNVLGRYFFAIAMIAFGAQHLWYADFVTRLVPKLPARIHGHSLLAYVFGVYLIASGVLLMLRKHARVTALVLGGTLLASLALLYVAALVAAPADVGLWIKAGKALTLSGGAFLIAGSLSANFRPDGAAIAPILNMLEKCISLGRYALGAFFVFCGILHFIYVQFVVGLVPAWVGAAVFWTYFSGVALLAAGVGIIVRPTARLAASLSALMVFLWVLMLHIPRAFANLHDSNETTAVFEAIAVTGTAMLVASTQQRIAARRAIERVPNAVILNPHELGRFQSVPTTATNSQGRTDL